MSRIRLSWCSDFITRRRIDVCSLCKGSMESGKANLPYRLSDKQLVLMMDVPALVCEQCGDEYIEIAVVRKFEKMIEKVKADGISMGFVEYDLAA